MCDFGMGKHAPWIFSIDDCLEDDGLDDYSAAADFEHGPAMDMMVAGIISLGLSLLMVCLCLSNKVLRIPPGALIWHRAMYTAVYSLAFVVGSYMEVHHVQTPAHFMVLAVYDFADTALGLWQLCIVWDLFVVVHDPFRPKRKRHVYHLFVILTALLVAGTTQGSHIPYRTLREMANGTVAPEAVQGVGGFRPLQVAVQMVFLHLPDVEAHASEGADMMELRVCVWFEFMRWIELLWNVGFAAVALVQLLGLRQRISLGLPMSLGARRHVFWHALVYTASYVLQACNPPRCTPRHPRYTSAPLHLCTSAPLHPYTSAPTSSPLPPPPPPPPCSPLPPPLCADLRTARAARCSRG